MSLISRAALVSDTTQIADGVIVNADVNAAAAIAYSKLNLGLSIVNADVAVGAAITASKIAGLAEFLADDVELSVAGDAVTTATFTAYDMLFIKICGRLKNTSGAGIDVIARLRFNNDAGLNYSTRRDMSGTEGTTVSAADIALMGALSAIAAAAVRKFDGYIIIADNSATREKYFTGEICFFTEGTGAGTAPSRVNIVGVWHNTVAQITRVDLVHTHAVGDADYDVGSRLQVLGADTA